LDIAASGLEQLDETVDAARAEGIGGLYALLEPADERLSYNFKAYLSRLLGER